MSKTSEKLEYFRKLKMEILEEQGSIHKQVQDLVEKHKQEQEDLKRKYEDMIAEVEKTLKNKAETYKAELKAWLGFTEGEKNDILPMLEGILRVVEESRS